MTFNFPSVCKNQVYMPEVNDLPKLDYENLEEIVAVRQGSFGVVYRATISWFVIRLILDWRRTIHLNIILVFEVLAFEVLGFQTPQIDLCSHFVH